MDYKFDTEKYYRVFDKETGELIYEGILEVCNVLSTIHRVEITDVEPESDL